MSKAALPLSGHDAIVALLANQRLAAWSPLRAARLLPSLKRLASTHLRLWKLHHDLNGRRQLLELACSLTQERA